MQPFDGGDPHGMIYSVTAMQEHASAVLLAKDVADLLEKQYSGWLWAVETDPRGGVINIRSLRLSGEWGYVLKLADIQDDPRVRRRRIIAAAGEILERFGLKAGPYRHADWLAASRNLAGEPTPDLSDRHARVRRAERDRAFSRAVANGEVNVQHVDVGGQRRILIESGYRKRADA